MSWDATTPADNEVASNGASRIRELKTDLATALSTEGIFPGGTPSAPVFRLKPLFDTTANRPAAGTAGRIFISSDENVIYRDNGAAWVAIISNGIAKSGGTLTGALHGPLPTSLASVAGVATLDETANSFLISGTEAITDIKGWSTGIAIIRWVSSRVITHDGTKLIQLNGLSRNVVAGDISVYEFKAANQVREISFFGLDSGKEVGDVWMTAQETVPASALECNGQSVLRTSYPGLYAKIGTGCGAADISHFNVPDLRGRFPRGWDHGAGTDPDAASRTANAAGGNTGDHVGTIQADDYKAHTHTIPISNATAQAGGSAGATSSSTNTGTSPTSGGNETRGKNQGLMFLIKI